MTEWRVTIVLQCTNGGQHRPRIVHRWIVDETTTAEAMARVMPGMYIELDDCPLCPRKPRFRSARWVAYCSGLLQDARASRTRVTRDISKDEALA